MGCHEGDSLMMSGQREIGIKYKQPNYECGEEKELQMGEYWRQTS